MKNKYPEKLISQEKNNQMILKFQPSKSKRNKKLKIQNHLFSQDGFFHLF